MCSRLKKRVLTANLFAGMRERARGVIPSIWSLTKADMEKSGSPACKRHKKIILN